MGVVYRALDSRLGREPPQIALRNANGYVPPPFSSVVRRSTSSAGPRIHVGRRGGFARYELRYDDVARSETRALLHHPGGGVHHARVVPRLRLPHARIVLYPRPFPGRLVHDRFVSVELLGAQESEIDRGGVQIDGVLLIETVPHDDRDDGVLTVRHFVQSDESRRSRRGDGTLGVLERVSGVVEASARVQHGSRDCVLRLTG